MTTPTSPQSAPSSATSWGHKLLNAFATQGTTPTETAQHIADTAVPVADLEVLRELDDLRPVCEREDDAGGRAVLRCLDLVCSHDLQAPQWLKAAYLARRELVLGAHVGSLDACFGRPWPKGVRLAIERRRIQNRRLVHAAVWAAVSKSPKTPITRHLFDDIAKQLNLGLSGGEVDRLYYSAVADGALDVAAWKRARKDQQPNPQESRESWGAVASKAAVNHRDRPKGIHR